MHQNAYFSSIFLEKQNFNILAIIDARFNLKRWKGLGGMAGNFYFFYYFFCKRLIRYNLKIRRGN